MPDLSSYIDFSVRFDLTTGTPKMILTDTSTYPSGVDEDITGYFSITSPDMGTDSGSWTSPDVTWDGDELTTKELVLRLNDEGNIQAGNYTVVYNVDHPDYTPTVLSRTFNTAYVPPTLNLVESFDVFTPELKYYDQTSYGISGYSYTIVSRDWEALSTPTGSINDTVATFDVVFEGDYYDTEYSMNFSVTVLYEHDTYSYLSIEDSISKAWTTSADSPPPFEDLVDYLNDLKDELDDNVSNQSLYKEYKSRYEYASSLLFNVKESCRAGLLDPLNRYVSEFLLVVNNFIAPPYTNTDEPIDPYDCGGESLSYKVYSAYVNQGGVDDFQYLDTGILSVGRTYYIYNSSPGMDFTNVGAPDNDEGTYFMATGTTPDSWGSLEDTGNNTLQYNNGAPTVTVIKDTIGGIYFRRIGVGIYRLYSNDSLFLNTKTFVPVKTGFAQQSYDEYKNMRYTITPVNISFMSINTVDGDPAEASDDILFGTPIEIRIY